MQKLCVRTFFLLQLASIGMARSAFRSGLSTPELLATMALTDFSEDESLPPLVQD